MKGYFASCIQVFMAASNAWWSVEALCTYQCIAPPGQRVRICEDLGGVTVAYLDL